MRFLETIKIISDIQKKFEESIKENIKPIDEVKKLINNNLNINNYLPLSKKQKENISKDIDKSSILRIQNYDTVFNFMHNSLNEIQNSLRNIISTKEKSNNPKNINFNNNVNIIINIDSQKKSKIIHNFQTNNIIYNKKIGFMNTKDLIEPRKKYFGLKSHQNIQKQSKKLNDLLIDSDYSEEDYSEFIKNEYKNITNQTYGNSIKLKPQKDIKKNIYIKKIKSISKDKNLNKINLIGKAEIYLKSKSPKIMHKNIIKTILEKDKKIDIKNLRTERTEQNENIKKFTKLKKFSGFIKGQKMLD